MLIVSFNVYAAETVVSLQLKVSAHDDNLGNPQSRCPIAPLFLKQSDNKLCLPNSTEHIIIKLSVNGHVSYTEVVLSDKVVVEFPDYLQGEYQISLFVGDKEYVGTINL